MWRSGDVARCRTVREVVCRAEEVPRVVERRDSVVNGRLRIAQMPRISAGESVYYEELTEAKLLLIGDAEDNVHSTYRPESVITNGYWDTFGVLPALVPDNGVVGIYGLAAGTIPRLIHAFYPEQKMIGWELDADVVDLARRHMGLAELEDAGCLEVVVGDCLSEEAVVPEGFAGLIVDIFLDNEVHPALSEVGVWATLKSRLRKHGRLMANIDPWEVEKMAAEFGGDLQWHSHPISENLSALSGPAPSETQWQFIPPALRDLSCGSGWRRWDSSVRHFSDLHGCRDHKSFHPNRLRC